MTIAMAEKAKSLNLSSLDTTLDQEEKGTDEMSDENILTNDDEFIGQEEFEDSVQKWKKVRYYYYFSTALLFTSFTRNRERWRERERDRERERETQI